MFRLMVALLSLGISTPAFSDDSGAAIVTVAECGSGGCNCTESALSVAEFEVILEADAPVGVEQLVVVDIGDSFNWSFVTIEELELMFGGDGSCSIEAPPVPEDGLWESTARFVSMSCGDRTEMMRTMMEPHLNDDAPARVVWGGKFDGAIYQRAWMVANPDAENVAPPFAQTSPTVSQGSTTMSAEGGSMQNSYLFELLSPRLFQADFRTTSQMQGKACDWHIRAVVRKISD